MKPWKWNSVKKFPWLQFEICPFWCLNSYCVTYHNTLLHSKVLVFLVVGCKDMILPQGTTFERHGHKAYIQCPSEKQKWELVCEGDKWIGNYKNCSDGKGVYIESSSPKYGGVSQSSASWLPFTLGGQTYRFKYYLLVKQCNIILIQYITRLCIFHHSMLTVLLPYCNKLILLTPYYLHIVALCDKQYRKLLHYHYHI